MELEEEAGGGGGVLKSTKKVIPIEREELRRPHFCTNILVRVDK